MRAGKLDLGGYHELNTYDVGLLQAQAYRALSTFMGSALQEFGLSMIEWGALGRICDNPGLRVSEIARALSVEVPRVIFLIKRLERKGYVVRKLYPSDKRVVVIISTGTGQRRRDEVETVVKERLRYFVLGVKRKDLTSYLKVLEFLAAKIYRG